MFLHGQVFKGRRIVVLIHVASLLISEKWTLKFFLAVSTKNVYPYFKLDFYFQKLKGKDQLHSCLNSNLGILVNVVPTRYFVGKQMSSLIIRKFRSKHQSERNLISWKQNQLILSICPLFHII